MCMVRIDSLTHVWVQMGVFGDGQAALLFSQNLIIPNLILIWIKQQMGTILVVEKHVDQCPLIMAESNGIAIG